MPFYTMSALMLLIALVSGLLDECVFKAAKHKLAAFGVLLCLLVFGEQRRVFTLELIVDLRTLLVLAATFLWCIFGEKGGSIKAVGVSALICLFPCLLFAFLEYDAAVLAYGIVSLGALLLIRNPSRTALACALAPVLSGVVKMLYLHFSIGYGYIELEGQTLDLQLTGMLFNAFFASLIQFNRELKRGTVTVQK